MPLVQATLATQLDTQVQNVTTEAAARTAWAQAWRNYFASAASNAVPITPAALTAAQAAMAPALTGLSLTGAAAIQAGILAWWGALGAEPAAAFPGATLIVLPPLTAGIAAALAPVFVANKGPGVTKTQALNAIATALHTSGGLGGTA